MGDLQGQRVFNFAQGAMVLFAALAMARFAQWIPGWTGLHNLLIVNALMVMAAWLIERWVLRRLVHQEGTKLLMATLGISYFLALLNFEWVTGHED